MNDSTKEALSIMERSAESVLLEKRLLDVKPGEIISYDDMSAAAMCDVRASSLVSRVVRLMVRDHQIVFYTIRRQGIRRAESAEIVTSEQCTPKRVLRMASRSMHRLATADYDTLSNEDKLKHSATTSALGAIALFSKPASQKKIEKAITAGAGPDLNGTLKLFVA